jgi:general stress protein YciG
MAGRADRDAAGCQEVMMPTRDNPPRQPGHGQKSDTMHKDASHKGDMSVREAGRKGGETVKQEVASGELPKDFYQKIGEKGGKIGGETVKQEVESGELPKDFYSQIGHKGGQKVKDLIDKGKAAESDRSKR